MDQTSFAELLDAELPETVIDEPDEEVTEDTVPEVEEVEKVVEVTEEIAEPEEITEPEVIDGPEESDMAQVTLAVYAMMEDAETEVQPETWNAVTPDVSVSVYAMLSDDADTSAQVDLM